MNVVIFIAYEHVARWFAEAGKVETIYIAGPEGQAPLTKCEQEVRTIFEPNVGQHWGQEPGTRRNVVPDFWYYSATYQESEKIR